MAMNTSSHCPKCQAPLRLPSSSVPLKFRCQTCGHIFVAPPTEHLAPPSVTAQTPPTEASSTKSTGLLRSPWFFVTLVVGCAALAGMCFIVASAWPTSPQDVPTRTTTAPPVDPLTQLIRQAEAGDAAAQVKLGSKYENGEGIGKDPAEAAKWYKLAGAQGNAEAQYRLGLIHAGAAGVHRDTSGRLLFKTKFVFGQEGVADNVAEAIKWFRLAAQQGHAAAEFEFGSMYQFGIGADENPTEAVKWYRLASDQGDAAAQLALGRMYAKGEGVTKDPAEAVKWYRMAADQGNVAAQYALGGMYYYGNGVAKDPAEAIKWYRLAAEQGDADAQLHLGGRYAKGEGVAKDPAEAVKWYRRAAEQDNAIAQFSLGFSYHFGVGVAKDSAEAAKWYRRAAEQGNASAQFNLGGMYYNGDGVTKDPAEAIKWYRMAAEQGNALAQYFLGRMYYNGDGVTKDPAEAVKWYRMAAEQGDALAQYFLGGMYYYGNGVTKDPAEAAKWFRMAAEQGEALAQYFLGGMYYYGNGVTKDPAEAIKWFRMAAEQGNVDAQINVGWMYYNGVGVTKDPAEAIKWLRMAAEQGNALAQSILGWRYYDGEGVAKDFTKGVEWFRRAAEQGNVASQNMLGLAYWLGNGVARDYVKAYAWFNIAAAGGYEDAAKSRDSLAQEMTPQQVAEAQRLSSAFQAKAEAPQTAERNDGFPDGPAVGQPSGSGSGFFITAEGHFVTNYHVVAGASKVVIHVGDRALPARVIRVDQSSDLALLKVEGKSVPLALRPSGSGVRVGQTVATVGYPNPGLQGQEPKFTTGQINALSGAGGDAGLYQISVPVQPGNSGGPLLDENGQVVGVIVAKLNVSAAVETSGALPENVNYAIKESVLTAFLESVPGLAERLPKATEVRQLKPEDVAQLGIASAGMVVVYSPPGGNILK
ncbi:MAG: trypsin-like peptidase domain-containing protein [Phycisphaeraceae bacterium]